MGPAGLVLGVVGTLAQLGGGYVAARGARQAGEQAQIGKNFEADQLRQNAGQTVASSQRAAMNEDLRAKLVASRALAVAGASGGGVTDPTVEKILADINGEGAYRMATRLFEGRARADQMETAADAAELEGQMAVNAGKTRGRGYLISSIGGALANPTLASVANSLYEKYGMGGPKQSGADNMRIASPVDWDTA